MTNAEMEAERTRIIAELHAMPGPKPLKPIPPDLKAEILADVESEEEWTSQMEELMRNGGHSFEEVLAAFDRAVEIAQ